MPSLVVSTLTLWSASSTCCICWRLTSLSSAIKTRRCIWGASFDEGGPGVFAAEVLLGCKTCAMMLPFERAAAYPAGMGGCRLFRRRCLVDQEKRGPRPGAALHRGGRD